LETVLRDKPDWTEALYNYGRTLMRLERDAEAEAALRRVLALDPGFTLAYRMLGNLLHRQGRVNEILELCAGALERDPGQLEIASFELFMLNFSDTISAEALFERHRAFGERLERARPPAFTFARATDAERRLRIGYVSGDLHSHPVALFLQPLLERHDRAGFEICCYGTSTRADDFTRRVAAHADLWRDAASASEAQLAETIHADRVDILVDLSGHSGIARLGAFALQPAPVQAAWLGYLNTTGLTRIAYRITDAVSDPPGAERLHTEKLKRLPHSQWCYRPFVQAPAASAPPCLRDRRVTFGSFTQIAKLSAATLALWANIFRQLPDARLAVLGVAPGQARDEVLRRLAAVGITVSRVTVAPFVPLREYYDWFARVDIALDSTPYSGGTTTCDALWMGVPVVTLAGSRPTSRSAASILTTLGLADWIASSPDEYVQRAIDASRNPALLAELRSTLRSKMQASPLMDEARFTKDLEKVYRQMWREWCAGHG
jgi:protein O-GlcNAc transferase